VSAPPGTRTPNPRIKSPNPVISSGFGLGQRVSFPQVSNESPGRRVPSSAAPVHGHRAPMEHRDRQSVLHRRTRWGSGGAVKAADFGSGGSVVTVTWSRDLERPGAVGSVGAGRGAVAQERRVVQPTADVEKTKRDRATRATCRSSRPRSSIRCPRLCRLIAGGFPQGGGGGVALPSGGDLCRASIAPPSSGGVRSYGPLVYSHGTPLLSKAGGARRSTVWARVGGRGSVDADGLGK
jgi:hypothetical protein